MQYIELAFVVVCVMAVLQAIGRHVPVPMAALQIAAGTESPRRDLAVFLAASTMAATLLLSGLLLPSLKVGARVDATPMPISRPRSSREVRHRQCG